jgi:hypothetical protein
MYIIVLNAIETERIDDKIRIIKKPVQKAIIKIPLLKPLKPLSAIHTQHLSTHSPAHARARAHTASNETNPYTNPIKAAHKLSPHPHASSRCTHPIDARIQLLHKKEEGTRV